jgi:CheY-like chemotaxis protein
MMQAGVCQEERPETVEVSHEAAQRHGRILVVDDDEAVRSAFSLALCGLGSELTVVDDGYKALELIERERFDLVFLDLRLPGLDGVRTLQVMRRVRPDIKVCILSAFVEEHMGDLIDLASESMRFELFRKPLDIDEIRALTATLLAPRRSRRQRVLAATAGILGRRIAKRQGRLIKN